MRTQVRALSAGSQLVSGPRRPQPLMSPLPRDRCAELSSVLRYQLKHSIQAIYKIHIFVIVQGQLSDSKPFPPVLNTLTMHGTQQKITRPSYKVEHCMLNRPSEIWAKARIYSPLCLITIRASTPSGRSQQSHGLHTGSAAFSLTVGRVYL